MKTFFVLLLVLLGSIQLEAKSTNTCNDSCQTKFYRLSADGSIGCSDANCLAEISFRSTLINGQIVFNINIIGYGSAAYKEPAFAIVFGKSSKETQYYCYPGYYGFGEAQVINGGKTFNNGSSQTLDGNVYCSWYMTYGDNAWPSAEFGAADLQTDSDFKIYSIIESQKFTIASDIADLPIYHLQSLKCCHTVHGDEKYQLIVNQNNDNQTNFFLQSFYTHPKILEAEFSDSNGTKLTFDCYVSSGYMKAYLKTDLTTDDIAAQITSKNFIMPGQCSWSLPTTIKQFPSTYETKDGVYDLKILDDGKVVYTEPNVSLRGFEDYVNGAFLDD